MSHDSRASNRLIHESSPYLRQHAHNPVDWYPWGPEALQASKQLDRPIFLSIGYSACHWCHVMEHESFENPAIAELMNRWYINIKVDREERPDLDQIYMNSVVALTGRGGWPMSVFLTPELQPFFGGTYWPPDARMGMPGFADVLEKVHEAWTDRRNDVAQSAAALTNAVVQLSRPQGDPSPLSTELLQNAVRSLSRAADRTYGGFGHAPKFPHPMDLRVLLRGWKRFGNDDALAVVRLTLDKMSQGGLYDQLGGGFHRYSTDHQWLVPHFEKMLYDNAQLVSTYLEAYQATHEPQYATVVRETLEYVLREMTQPEGGFYSTQDADSEGVEGKFFVWSEDEIVELLGPNDARYFNYVFDVTPRGNWEGENILNRVKTYAQAAKMLSIGEPELLEILHKSKQTLFAARSQRVAPGRDEKILVSWNGLMIAAFAQAAQVLSDERYAVAAREATDFILAKMTDENGRLLHAYKDGQARLPAYLDDYACLIDGLTELYQAVGDSKYVDEAVRLAHLMLELFGDAEDSGFFYTAKDHEALIARTKDSQDTATPSGNGMAAFALLKLARLIGDNDLEQSAARTLEMLSGQMKQAPSASGQSLLAVDFLIGPACEIVVAEGNVPDQNRLVREAIHERFLPNKVVATIPGLHTEATTQSPLRQVLEGKTPIGGQVTTYVCERGACREPATGPDALRDVLARY